MDKDLSNLIRERNKINRLIEIGSAIMRVFDNESLPFFMCIFDIDTLRFVSVSTNCFRIFGYTVEEMEGEVFTKFTVESDIKKSIETVDINKKLKVTISDFQNTYMHKDGKTKIKLHWFSDKATENHTFCFAIID